MTRPLSAYTDTARQPLALQLAGDHQEQNASLAVALAASWEGSERGGASISVASRPAAHLPNGTTALSNGHGPAPAAAHEPAANGVQPGSAVAHAAAIQAGCLPAPYINGLRNVFWPGRNQVRYIAITIAAFMPPQFPVSRESSNASRSVTDGLLSAFAFVVTARFGSRDTLRADRARDPRWRRGEPRGVGVILLGWCAHA